MTPHQLTAGHGISPLLSLRADLAGRPLTRHDDDAIAIASLLRHAAAFPGTGGAKRSLAESRRIARRMLTPAELREGPGFDEPGDRSSLRLLRTAADHTMRALGNVTLATNMLDSLATLIPADTVDGGRLLAQRSAASWYRGYSELSLEQSTRVMRMGRKLGARELVARGLHGIAHVRMCAGNIPEAERLVRRVIRIAGDEFPRVTSSSTLKLAVINAVRGDFDAALGDAWRAYQLSRSYERGRIAVLANLAQILLDAGYPGASRAAARHLLRGAMPREHVFAVVSTYASASAAIDDARAVDWCATSLLALAKTPSFAQHVADALLEVSFALEHCGRASRAQRLRARAHEMAVRHGYHDIAYMAEHGMRRGVPRTPIRITRATQAIVTEVQALEADNLPLAEIHAG